MKTRDLMLILAVLVPGGLLAWWLYNRSRPVVTVDGGRPVDDAWNRNEAAALDAFQQTAGAGVGEDGVASNAGGTVAGVGK